MCWSLGLGCFPSFLSVCVRAEPGWCGVTGGRFIIQGRMHSSSSSGGCGGVQQWGNSSVHWEWKEMCLAPRLMEGSKVQPWPGCSFKTKTVWWKVGESSLPIVSYPDTESFQRGRRPCSLSAWSVYLLGCRNSVLCGDCSAFLWDSQNFSE